MTTAVKYSLDEFVHDMSALVDEQPDQERIFDLGSTYLERLINNPDALPEEYRIPAVRNGRRANHGTYLLHYGDNGLLVTSVVWGPGDHIGPHDHCTWGMIGVMDNGITETRFTRHDDRSRDDYAIIEKDRETLVKARRRQPAHPRSGRNTPDGQLLRQAHRRDSRLWQRPARTPAQQLQPRIRRGEALRHHPLRQLLEPCQFSETRRGVPCGRPEIPAANILEILGSVDI